MIFIVVKFTVRPEFSADWLDHVAEFTEATRAEPGNIFFEWSRSVDTDHQFVLVEAFRSAEAGRQHVNSEHFKAAMPRLAELVATTPGIINVEVSGEGWSRMAELTPAGAV